MHQQPASDPFEIVGLRCAREACRQHPHVRLGCEDLARPGVEFRCDHDLDEMFGYRSGRRGVEFVVESHDAPERCRGVGGKGALVRVAE